MLIREACELLKKELLGNGYEYGFCRNGKTYRPDTSRGYDSEFFELLLSEYRLQSPEDTRTAKVGTCHDVVILMRSILGEHGVPSKAWLLHDEQRGKFHTVLTFEAEGKTVYLELTPRSGKPWYGKELVFDSDQDFLAQYAQNGCEVIEVTDSLIVGKAPDFVLSRMDRDSGKQG